MKLSRSRGGGVQVRGWSGWDTSIVWINSIRPELCECVTALWSLNCTCYMWREWPWLSSFQCVHSIRRYWTKVWMFRQHRPAIVSILTLLGSPIKQFPQLSETCIWVGFCRAIVLFFSRSSWVGEKECAWKSNSRNKRLFLLSSRSTEVTAILKKGQCRSWRLLNGDICHFVFYKCGLFYNVMYDWHPSFGELISGDSRQKARTLPVAPIPLAHNLHFVESPIKLEYGEKVAMMWKTLSQAM